MIMHGGQLTLVASWHGGARRSGVALLCSLALSAGCSSSSPPGDLGGSLADAASTAGDAARDASASGSADGEPFDATLDGPPLLNIVGDRFPAANAPAACADAPLRLTFSSPVTLGTSGRVQLWHAGDVGAAGPVAAEVVDTIDVGAPMWSTTIGGRLFNVNLPVQLEGQEARIAFKTQAMKPGARYYVTIESGVFLDAAQQPAGVLLDPAGWAFTTAAPSPSSPGSLTVAGDGSGDFCTIQGAIDFIPPANTSPVTVTIKKGTYREIVFIGQKSNVTLHGEDRKGTIIAYANNNALNPHTATRAMVEVEGSNGLVVENITLHNLTPQGGSQAEALRVEPSDQVILRDADFLSTQDTLLLTGRVYVTNCYVEGNVDFIWGKGTAYFDRCELKTVGRAGYEVQARNAAGVYGYVFVDSTLTSTPTLTGNFLGRIDASVYPGSQVAYINCKMDKHIDPKGWLITPAGTVVTPALSFGEYQSTDLAGQLLDVSLRIPESKQLSAAEAAMMRDKTVVLAGWNPTPAAQ